MAWPLMPWETCWCACTRGAGASVSAAGRASRTRLRTTAPRPAPSGAHANTAVGHQLLAEAGRSSWGASVVGDSLSKRHGHRAALLPPPPPLPMPTCCCTGYAREQQCSPGEATALGSLRTRSVCALNQGALRQRFARSCMPRAVRRECAAWSSCQPCTPSHGACPPRRPCLQLFSPDGALLCTLASGGITPEDVAYSPAGFIAVADTVRSTLFRFDV